ncbi:MAG TPA: plastocyanin/azurin family copper-binding protein [Gaiellaceae bacterium]
MKIAFLAALVAALAVPAASASVSAETLKGTVGPGFTIKLSYEGKTAKKLKAGTYKVVISDKGTIHNFHLTGPGVNKKTSVSGTGTTTWTLKLRKGTYKYVCDPHASSMKGSFTVT